MTVTRETKELTTIDARRELTKLQGKMGAEPATVAVTRRGKLVLAIMIWEDYQAIMETLEILSDNDAIEQLRRSIKEVKTPPGIQRPASQSQRQASYFLR